MAEKVGNIQNNLLWCDAGWLQVFAVLYFMQWQHKWKKLWNWLSRSLNNAWSLRKKWSSYSLSQICVCFLPWHSSYSQDNSFPIIQCVHCLTFRLVWNSECSYPASHAIFLLNEFVMVIMDEELLSLLLSSPSRSLDFWVQLISQLSYYCLVSAH